MIILDAELGPCRYEHHFQDNLATKRWGNHITCIKENGDCPACRVSDQIKQSRSNYMMFLTVQDMAGYTKRDNTHVPHTKRLLPVHQNGIEFYLTQMDANQGRLRGLHMVMRRTGAKEQNTGQPQAITYLDEAQLMSMFGNPEVRNQEGRVIKQANAEAYPFDYNSIFTDPTEEEIRGFLAGIGHQVAAQVGSRAEAAEAFQTNAEPGVGAYPAQAPQELPEEGARDRSMPATGGFQAAANGATPAVPAGAQSGGGYAVPPGGAAIAQAAQAPATAAGFVARSQAPAGGGGDGDLDDDIPF